MTRETGWMERRSFVVRLGAVVLAGWTLLAVLSPWLRWTSRITYPAWLAVYLAYLFDRKLKFRLFYEGLVGTAAYWLLHDWPQVLQIQALMPASAGQFLFLLTLTGMLAALPFGRRGPAVAGVSGALLAGLWMIYAFGRSGRLIHPFAEVDLHLLPAVVFMVLGGLVTERFTRAWRGDRGYAGPNPALWAFVLGAAFTRVIALW